MFSGATNTTVTGGTMIHYGSHVHGPPIGFERLEKAAASNAFHNSGDIVDQPKCHPNTRTAVINKIMDWIRGLGVDDQNAAVLWLYGPAGAGKSAIAHKIAELCVLHKLLLATFFFSRSDHTRNNSKSLIATIAYQIATSDMPLARERIFAAIEHDPLILTRSLEDQLATLIVEPLRGPLEAGYFNAPTSRRLIIIDGLDECNNPAVQCKILEVITLLFHNYHLPLIILIGSRPEQHITYSFSNESLSKFHTTLALDNTYKPDDDIRLYMGDSFRKIKCTHRMRHHLDPSWPSADVLDGLVKKSSGQFIYASTVVQYVSSIRHQPADRLNVVRGIRPPLHAHDMPFDELDALYRHIFSFVPVEDKKTVLLILGFRLAMWTGPRAFIPMELQNTEKFLGLDRGSIEVLLGDLCSVITISNAKPYIHILHASLGDFLLDRTRSKEFYIDLSDIHTTCMHRCFFHMKNLSQCYSRYFSYASGALMWHCENTPPSASVQLREEIINFSLLHPDSCFPGTFLSNSLFNIVPRFLMFIKQQPFKDADEIYTQKCSEVLSFFASRLQPYYSKSRFTLLLTLLDTPGDFLQSNDYFGHIVPLPSRLETKDFDMLSLHHISGYVPGRDIFRNFLESGHPLALDGERHSTAALACFKIIFKRYHYQVPLSYVKWFSQHYCHPKGSQKRIPHQRHTDRPSGRGWNREKIWQTLFISYSRLTHLPNLTQHLRTCVSNHIPWGQLAGLVYYPGISGPIDHVFDRHFNEVDHSQKLRSEHLQFLLHKSAYSDDLLDFASQRVFRLGYLQRTHPTYIKKAISALAKYIYRVTGRTAERKACESLWGQAKWFTAQ